MDPNNLLTIFLFSVVYRELGSRFRATPGYTSPVGIFLCLETPARPGRTTSCKFFFFFFGSSSPPLFPINYYCLLFTLLPWLNKSFVFNGIWVCVCPFLAPQLHTSFAGIGEHGQWVVRLPSLWELECNTNFVSFCLKQVKIFPNGVRKIILIQRLNNIIFSYTIGRYLACFKQKTNKIGIIFSEKHSSNFTCQVNAS